MKIAVDAYYSLFSTGGIFRYARCLIGAMLENSSDEEIILFINRFREKGKIWRPRKGKCNLRHIYFPRHIVQTIWDNLQWPSIELFCGSIDLFHGLHFVLPPARNACRVLTVHDLTYLKFPDYFLDRKLNERGYRKELPQGLKRADAVIAVSEKTREDLVELFNFPAEKIKVIHEGVEPHFLNHVEGRHAESVRQRYGLTKPYLIYLVGTPEPRKNLKKTIAAAKKAAPKLPLALIGPKKPLQTLLAGSSHHSLFLDVVPEAHLPALLSGAKISLYPSLYEGFGLPVIESMACGAPVITSKKGALPEVAGHAAILVDPERVDSIASGISELLNNKELQLELKTAGIKRAAHFTWQKAAEKTLSLYKDLI